MNLYRNSKIVFVLVLLVCSAIVLAGPPPARVNIAHLAPFADTLQGTAVSVNVDGSEVVPTAQFNQSSGYLDVFPSLGRGEESGFDIFAEVFAPPQSAPPAAINGTFTVDFGLDFTIVAIGNITNQPLDFLFLEDDPTVPLRGDNALLRIVHAAPFAANLADTEVSLRLQDGTPNGTVIENFTNVPYGADTGFLSLPPGTYDLVVSTPDGSTPLIDPEPVELTDGQVITVFAVGDIVNQPLGITAQSPTGALAALPLAAGTPAFTPVPTLGMIGLFLMIALLAFVAVRRLV